jgi:hypothetical protein
MHLKAIAIMALSLLAPTVTMGQSVAYECTTPGIAPGYCCSYWVNEIVEGRLGIHNGCESHQSWA